MATSSGFVRQYLFAGSGELSIRTLGAEGWVKLPHWPGSSSVHNVMRPDFMPGSFSVVQYTEHPISDSKGIIAKNVYMSKATFDTANSYNIHVKECKFRQGDSDKDTNFKIRIELVVACKLPPATQGLMTAAGVHRADMLDLATETSEPVASSVAIANIADRWLSGDQEIKLTFIRATQVRPRTRLWFWDAFVAFVCGAEWATQDRHDLDVVSQKSLKEVANARFGSPFAEFETKEGDWISIKPKPLRSMSWSSASVQETAQQQRAARELHFEMMQSETVASSSRIGAPVIGEATALGSPMGKRKAEEQVENPRWEKKVRLESRERLREKLAEVRGERCAWQAAESHARDMAEKAAEKERELQLRIDTLDP